MYVYYVALGLGPGPMCYNHSKSCGFRMASLFHVFTNLVSQGGIWDLIFESFGSLWDTFSDFEGLGDGLEI